MLLAMSSAPQHFKPLSLGKSPDKSPKAAAASIDPAAEALRRLEWLTIWIFWGFIAALTFINAVINDATSSSYHLPASAPLVAALIDSFIWGCITPVILRLTSRYPLDRTGWPFSLFLLLLLGIVLSVIIARFMAFVRYEQAVYYSQAALTNHQIVGGFDPLPILRRFWFMNEYIIYLLILAAGFAYDYFARFRARHDQARILQTQTMQLRAELAEAHLGLLRSQLDPHFLFNTLNTISSLLEGDPKNARRMISQLSGLLRDSLQDKDLEVSLERELTFLRRYIEIMQTRFRGRLQVIENIDSNTLTAMVPTLILQPLVENAIKHGIAKVDGIGRIEIKTECRGAQLILSIIDNGKNEAAQRLREERSSTGLGLSNTRARLLQSYGDQQSLSVESHPQGGAMVCITLPFHTLPSKKFNP